MHCVCSTDHTNNTLYFASSIFHLDISEIMKQMKRVLPYDLHSLTWNKAHKVNDEEVRWLVIWSLCLGFALCIFDLLLIDRNIAIAGVLVIGTWRCYSAQDVVSGFMKVSLHFHCAWFKMSWELLVLCHFWFCPTESQVPIRRVSAFRSKLNSLLIF